MNKKLEIQEIAIALLARKHNPALLSPDFLKANGIIPADWVLAKLPLCTDTESRLVFENGVSIVATLDRVLFSEILIDKDEKEVNIARSLCQYIRCFPTLDYRAVAINPRGYVAFGAQKAVENYLGSAYLPPKNLQKLGKLPEKGGVNLLYSLAGRLFNLQIDRAILSLPDEPNLSVALVSNNFHYNLASDRKLQQLKGIIDKWRWDLKIFQEIVEKGCMQIGSILELEQRLEKMDESYYGCGVVAAHC